MAAYLPILTMMVLATLFAALSFAASRLLAPQRPTAAKDAPYECGIIPSREPTERFPVRFYLVAMIFIVFDIEIVFLYPWAVLFRQLGLFGVAEMTVFAIAVFVSFLYLISNGALDWGPTRRLQVLPDGASGTTGAVGGTARTTESTIRRIGREPSGHSAPLAASRA